jgi:CTD small phosphatase-like protein 2
MFSPKRGTVSSSNSPPQSSSSLTSPSRNLNKSSNQIKLSLSANASPAVSKSTIKGVKKLSLESPTQSSLSSGYTLTSPASYRKPNPTYSSPSRLITKSSPTAKPKQLLLHTANSNNSSLLTMPVPLSAAGNSSMKLKLTSSPSLSSTQPNPLGHSTVSSQPSISNHSTASNNINFDPPSPIASASPTQRRLKLSIAAAAATSASSSSKPIARKLESSYTIGSSSPSSEAKKMLFSPAYLRQQEEEKAKKLAAGKSSANSSSTSSRGSSAGQKSPQKSTISTISYNGGASVANYHLYQQQQQSSNSSTVDMTDEFDPFVFIKNLPPLSLAMKSRPSPLPRKAANAPRITLALDLDETLVHCSVQPISKAELTFQVNFNNTDYEVYVRTRPHMKQFLREVSKWFEIIIFTASQRVYADKLLNILDPTGEFIQHRVFRESCVCVGGNYLKDLHILGRDMNAVALVDNSVQAFSYQLSNGIPIESWFDDDNDEELLYLLPFLNKLKDAEDVRPLIRDTFKLEKIVANIK